MYSQSPIKKPTVFDRILATGSRWVALLPIALEVLLRKRGRSSGPESGRIVNTRPLVFLHIPKTAGASVIEALDSYFDVDDIAPAYNAPDFEAVPNDKLLYRGHLNADIQQRRFPDAECFTIGREPAALMRSMYHWMQMPLSWRHQARRAKRIGSDNNALRESSSRAQTEALHMTFSECLTSNLPEIRQRLIGIYARALTDSRFVPGNEQSAQIAKAASWIDACCAVATTEDLETGLQVLCEHRNWPAPSPLPNIHKRKAPISTDGQEVALKIAEAMGDAALYERIRERARSSIEAFFERCNGPQNARSYLNERHAEQFFREAPEAAELDYDAWHFWPGFDWGLRTVRLDRIAYRRLGTNGQSTLIAKVLPGHDYEVSLTVLDVPLMGLFRRVTACSGDEPLKFLRSEPLLRGHRLTWSLPAHHVGDGKLRITFRTKTDPDRLLLDGVSVRQP